MDNFHGRVLLVDDDPSLLKTCTRSLIGAGFNVTQASNGREALHRMEAEPFEAVLSGVKMPRVDGFTLLRRTRMRFPDLPVVLMLDKPDNRAALKATELGATQALIKPIAVDALVQTVSYCVELRRSRQPHRGAERSQTVSIPATDAKNEFGRMLEKAIQGATVVITRHDVPKAVLVSVDQFNHLSREPQLELETLTREFDSLLARMQTRAARGAMQSAFEASPRQLGRAAVTAARKRA